MGTVGAIRERDMRGRFASRPSPYQGSRPGANVAGPTGLTMETALAGKSTPWRAQCVSGLPFTP